MNFQTIKFISKSLKPIRYVFSDVDSSKVGQRVILTYHGISKSAQFNSVELGLFREQIAWLKEKYSVVSLASLINRIKSPTSTLSNLAAVTFDDAYTNFYDLALPVLYEYNCHATVFVPTGKVGKYNDWDESTSGFIKMDIMSYDMLNQLPEERVELGSHGISHVKFSTLSAEGIMKELTESRLHLEQKTGKQVKFFAFPYGVYPIGKKKYSDQNGCILGDYQAACTTSWGRYNTLKDINSLRRIGIWDSDSMQDFYDKMNGCYDWLEKKESIGRHVKYLVSYL